MAGKVPSAVFPRGGCQQRGCERERVRKGNQKTQTKDTGDWWSVGRRSSRPPKERVCVHVDARSAPLSSQHTVRVWWSQAGGASSWGLTKSTDCGKGGMLSRRCATAVHRSHHQATGTDRRQRAARCSRSRDDTTPVAEIGALQTLDNESRGSATTRPTRQPDQLRDLNTEPPGIRPGAGSNRTRRSDVRGRPAFGVGRPHLERVVRPLSARLLHIRVPREWLHQHEAAGGLASPESQAFEHGFRTSCVTSGWNVGQLDLGRAALCCNGQVTQCGQLRWILASHHMRRYIPSTT